jgi:hypothetical protein
VLYSKRTFTRSHTVLAMVLGPPPQLEWLNQVLNEQGSKALPYTHDAKSTLRQHLLDLVTVSAHLHN